MRDYTYYEETYEPRRPGENLEAAVKRIREELVSKIDRDTREGGWIYDEVADELEDDRKRMQTTEEEADHVEE